MAVHAQLKQVDHSRFLARADDGPAYMIDGGDEACGTTPMQMMLMSIAACTSIDVSHILAKKRVQLAEFQVNIVGEEAQEHPQRFTKLIIEYVFHGKNLKTKALEQAIELSETKYCCALASVNAELESSYRIVTSNE
tara:strand:+ start:294 stop:704 length:411 start_codon:yes stop_codon:yes gene_type:complete